MPAGLTGGALFSTKKINPHSKLKSFSASSNSGTSYLAFAYNGSSWVSASDYSTSSGVYSGTSTTNGALGEWIQTTEDQPVVPTYFEVTGNALTFSVFGSNDGGASFNRIPLENQVATGARANTSAAFDIFRLVITSVSDHSGFANVTFAVQGIVPGAIQSTPVTVGSTVVASVVASVGVAGIAAGGTMIGLAVAGAGAFVGNRGPMRRFGNRYNRLVI